MILITAALALVLCGCGDTIVYIPENAMEAESGEVIRIAADPDKATENTWQDLSALTQPEQTQPPQTNAATISKKTGSTSNKASSSTTTGANKDTVTAGGAKETEPAEDGSGNMQVTEPIPVETELPRYDISGYVISDLEYAILDRINEYRVEADLELWYLEEYLCAIASCRSFEASYLWSHTRPDGRDYGTVLDEYDYGGNATGELLGYSTGSAAAIVDKWMSSESHRSMLLGSGTVLGIGVYHSGGVIYVACLIVE